MEQHEELTGIILDEAFQLHKDLGPGLLESVYSALLTLRLVKRGLKVGREKSVVFTYEGVRFEDGLRIDLLVEGCVVVELKSVEQLAAVHYKQVLTYSEADGPASGTADQLRSSPAQARHQVHCELIHSVSPRLRVRHPTTLSSVPPCEVPLRRKHSSRVSYRAIQRAQIQPRPHTPPLQFLHK